MRRAVFSLVALALAAGCGATPRSATSPGLGAATITGSLVGSGTAPGAFSAAAGPSAGVTVSVVGGSRSTTVDRNDDFTLTNVPPGTDVNLQFTGAGVNGRISIGPVEPEDEVTLTIMRTAAGLELHDRRRHRRDFAEVDGRVEALPPATPAGTFVVARHRVFTDDRTLFVQGDQRTTFDALTLGQFVHVTGLPADRGILARAVRMRPAAPDHRVHIEGPITDLAGTASDFRFTIRGWHVKGNATTEFRGGTFADLANGVRVEVTGLLRDGHVLAARIAIR